MMPNLKKLRTEKGISQQKLAEIVGVSQQSVNGYENYSVQPDIGILRQIAECFDTSIDYLVGHTDIRRKIERVEAHELSEREAGLASGYRALSGEKKECVDGILRALLRNE